MLPKQYKPVILKALKDGQTRKFSSLEEMANSIVETMEVFDEMLALAGGQVPEIPKSTSRAETPLIVTGDSPSFADVSERIVPPDSLTEEEILRRKQEAIRTYKMKLPAAIDIQPPSFDNPLTLNLLGIESSPGNFPMFRVKYAPQGASSEAMFVIIPQSVTDKILSPAELIEEVKKQGNGLYSSAPRTVQVRMPPPIDTLELQLAGSPSANTDAEVSDSDMAFWRKHAPPIR